MNFLYTVKDFLHRDLARNSAGRIAVKEGEDYYTDLVMYISSKNKNIGYIIPTRKYTLTLSEDPFECYVYAIGVTHYDNGYVALNSIGNGNFLTSTHSDGIKDYAEHSREWEHFTLHVITNFENEYVLNAVNSIEKFNQKYENFQNIDVIQEKKELVTGLLASVRHMHLDVLEHICRHIMRDMEWVNIICEYDTSIWSDMGLAYLVQYINGKNNHSLRNNIVGEIFDFLSNEIVPTIGVDAARPISPVEIILRTIRAQVKPQKDFCILATARNEGIYLAEWIAYHKSIGFEGFFLYINDCQDNSKKILSECEKNGIVKYYESFSKDGVNVQGKAYGHALTFVPEILDYKWVLVIDLDELFVFDKNLFDNLNDYFNYVEKRQVDTIAFDWVNMGSNKQVRWNKKPYFERFSNQGFHEASKIKTAFRPHKVARSYPHFPIEFINYSLIRRNSVGNLMTTRMNEEMHGPHGKHLNDKPDSRFAVIYHYYFKSVEEFIWKSSRNRGDEPKSTEILDVAFHNELAGYYLENFKNEKRNTSDELSFPNIINLVENFNIEIEKIISIKEIRHEIEENYKIYQKEFSILLEKLRNNIEYMDTHQKNMLDLILDSAKP